MNVAEVQLSFKTKVSPKDRPQVSSSRDAYDLLMKNWDKDGFELYETFMLLLLNRANKAIGFMKVSQGGVSGTVADPKIIFAVALKSAASGIIVAHNHPSGNLKPSQSDIDLTRKLKEGAKCLEIQFLDHLICTTDGYYSFADEGMIG
ncbi:MAG: JAB domain-containing protein [Cyclobacteriaceae bacterium]|nr:JAB domain-containing protein [Cyclobacteriaceae bacterium]